MKINEEEFNKLNQLDRIECRQIESRLKEEFKSNNFFVTINIISPYLLFYLLFALVTYGTLGIKVFSNLMIYFGILLYLSFMGLLICLALDLFSKYKLNKEMEKLEKKFFKLELK